MEKIDLMHSFAKVIQDSADEENKISQFDSYDVYIKLKELVKDKFGERYMIDWIDYCKIRKPGYVIEDLKIILQLGMGSIFGQFFSVFVKYM